MPDKSQIHLRRLCFTAVLVAIAVTMRVFFTISIPLQGEDGMRIGFAGVFSSLPAFLFGPLWGAISSGATDVLGHFLRPQGAYLPHITAVAVAAGFLRGGGWLLLKKRGNGLARVVLIGSALVLLFGAVNWIIFRVDGVTADIYMGTDTSDMFFISRWAINRSAVAQNPMSVLQGAITAVTLTPFVAGILGLVLYVVSRVMNHFLHKENNEIPTIMPLLIAMLVAAWFQSTMNTIILRQYVFSSWQLLPFWMVWFPRIFQTTITTVVHVYFVALLMNVCKRQKHVLPYLRS